MDTHNQINSDFHMNSTHSQKHILDSLIVILKWRKFIVIDVVLVTIIAAIISFMLPKWYKATTSVLPPKEESGLGSLSAASNLLKNISASTKLESKVLNEGAYNYLAILKSRSSLESVVRKFDLIHVYNIKDSSIEDAIKELIDNSNFEIQPEEYITIEVIDKDPQRAADMANYFVTILNEISIKLATQEAHSNREFIAQAVEKYQVDLRKAEEDLKIYQEEKKIVVNPTQNSSSIAAIAEIYVLRARKEIELAILKRSASAENPQIQQLKLELDEINRKIDVIPQVAMEALRLYREVVIQQKIGEYLIPLLEQAKVNENKEIPATLILDRAVPPEKKDAPKRMLIIILSALSAFLLSIMYVFFATKISEAREKYPEHFRRLAAIFSFHTK